MNIFQQVTKEISYLFLPNCISYIVKSKWRYVLFNTVYYMHFAKNI